MYVVVTGASQGIGAELARIYASEGKSLVLVARNESKLNQLAQELKQKSVDVIIKPYDLSVQENCFKLFDEIKGLDIDVFINNAGYGNLGTFDMTDLDLEMNMLDLNIKAVHIMTKLYIQNFEEGVVVNVSSMAAFLPTPKLATYAATKTYVHNISRAINFEMKKQNRNLKVLCVVPGPVKTGFNERANASINSGMDSYKCAKSIYNGIKKRKTLIVPGISMKILRFVVKLIPLGLLLRLSYKIQSNKK